MSDCHAHFAFVAPDPADLAPLFPGYEIQGLIATGGMGAVYRAVQKSLDRTVALKILPVEFSQDAAFCEGFEAEAKAMARMNHPNLIGVYDFGAARGMLFIIMEFVPGESLHHLSHSRAVDPAEAIRLVTGICRGLGHAHENGILHRDIKPSNILLDLNGQPKIGDFGLAHPIERKIDESEAIYGTPGYTAPEVLDSPGSVDHRADIFSVGVLLHELLTGKLPAADKRPASAICRCDARFDAIIRKATQAKPADRYAKATEMVADLRKIADSPKAKPAGPPAPGARRPMVPRRPNPPARKPKAATTTDTSFQPIWVAAILVVVGLIVYLSVEHGKPQVKPAAGPPPASTAPTPRPGAGTVPKAVPKARPPGLTSESSNTVLDPTDLVGLRQRLGQEVTVQGNAIELTTNGSGSMRFLNFSKPASNALSFAFLVSDSPEEFTQNRLSAYVGKTVLSKGIVYEADGAVKIRVRHLDELKVIEN